MVGVEEFKKLLECLVRDCDRLPVKLFDLVGIEDAAV